MNLLRTPKFSPLLIVVLALAACGGNDAVVTADEIPQDPDDIGGGDDGEPPAIDGEPAQPGLPLGGGSYAVGVVTVQIEHPEFDTVTYELACFGDTATLTPEPTDGVRADLACTALADPVVEAYLTEGPPADQVCTEIFGGPDTAHFTGMLNGKDVDIVVDRTNGCGIDAWDILLADVLPIARGEV